MDFLRRLLGGGHGEAASPSGSSVDPSELEQDEREYERELARAEATRLDELQQRQLRYADYAWTPPPQGSERRADDEDRGREV